MYHLSPKWPLNEWFDDRFYMKLWILCGTGRDISIRFAQSIWQRRANSDETGGHLLRFCRNSATGGSEFHCTCYGFNGKVQQVEYQFVDRTPTSLTVRQWKAWNSVWWYRIRCFWPQKGHRQADFDLKLCLTVYIWVLRHHHGREILSFRYEGCNTRGITHEICKTQRHFWHEDLLRVIALYSRHRVLHLIQNNWVCVPSVFPRTKKALTKLS